MKSLRFEIGNVNEAFKEITDDNIRFYFNTRRKNLWAIIRWFDISPNVNIESRMLQNINVHFLVAMEHLGKLKSTNGEV